MSNSTLKKTGIYARKNNIVIGILFLLCWSIMLIVGYSKFTGFCVSLLLIVNLSIHIINAYKYYCLGILIIFLFMLSYVTVPFVYFLYGGNIGVSVYALSPGNVFNVAMILLLFFSVLTIFIRYSNDNTYKKPVYPQFRHNSYVWAFCLILTIILILVGKSGQTIFEAGGYGNALGESEISSKFSYATIPLVCALLYSNSNKKRLITFAVALFYIFRDLSFGGRIDSVILCILIFLLYFRFFINRKNTILLLIIGFVFISLYGMYRSSVDTNLGNFVSNNLNRVELSTGNSIDVYYASMRIFYLMEHNILTMHDRLLSGIYFLISIVMPYSALPSLANLSSYLQDVYWSGGGGLAPIFIFAMFGYIGVIIFSYWIAKCINVFIHRNSNESFYVYSLFVISTTPRWFAYNPIIVIKFCLFGYLFYVLMKNIQRRIKDI